MSKIQFRFHMEQDLCLYLEFWRENEKVGSVVLPEEHQQRQKKSISAGLQRVERYEAFVSLRTKYLRKSL